MNGDNRLLGKFRGVVVNNVDPLAMGRLQVQVPSVSAIPLASWALPCVPVAGPNYGSFAVPLPGSGVWVEFEQGDPDYPIWVGCFWGSAAELPVLARTTPPPAPGLTFQTPLKNGVVVADAGGPMGVGGITLQSASGATLAVNDTGIFINNAKGAQISLAGPTVDINLGALTVV